MYDGDRERREVMLSESNIEVLFEQGLPVDAKDLWKSVD